MLKSKSVAKLIEDQLNKNTKDEKFRVVYEVGSYKGTDINCVLKQGKGTIKPIANYTNVNTPYTLEVIMPVQCGEDRIDNVVDIVNDFIMALNGKVKNLDNDEDNGKLVFLINPLEIGGYESRATVGQSVIIKVDFNVEYSTSVGTKYEMALITTPFEYGTQNVRKFKDFEEKDNWVAEHISNTDAPFYEILAPNINSLVITQQRYLNPRGVDANDILMHNYAIIKETKWNDDVKYYFYYVTGSNIDQYNMIVVDLTMDTITTFYDDLEFGDCFISKAHLDRWLPDINGVHFNTLPDSPLFEREDNVPSEKFLKDRYLVPMFHSILHKDFYQWYQSNVIGWLYLYINGGKNYNVGNVITSEGLSTKFAFKRLKHGTSRTEYTKKYGSMYNTMPCLAVPVYAGYGMIRLRYSYTEGEQTKTGFLDLTVDAIDEFLEMQGGGENFVYSLKFSTVPPFDVSDLDDSAVKGYDIQDGNLIILCDNYKQNSIIDGDYTISTLKATLGLKGAYGIRARNGDSDGYLYVEEQRNINMSTVCALNGERYYCNFNFGDIVGVDRNIRLNPKLYGIDFMSIKLSDYTQNGTDYDFLKIGTTTVLNINYTEALTPDMTKKYIRIQPAQESVYHHGVSSNLTGFVVSDDTSLTLETEAYETMLANNKNFFLQNNTNRGIDIGQGIFNAGSGALQGAFLAGGNPVGAVIGAGVSIANTVMSSVKSKINENYTLDNLKNAPNSIKGAMGNAIFNSMYADAPIIVEVHEALEFEKKIADDQMFMNGFNFNKVANIKDYDNIRHYFNFIQASIDNIIGEISTPIREDIRQRFANGVRFWNEDNIQYEKENYERWLNNEQ